MSRVGQTQLRGHGLQREGRPYERTAHGFCFLGPSGPGCGVCSCGEASPELPSNAARRRWHNDHKAALRAPSSEESPTP